MFIKGNLPVSGCQGGAGVAKGVFDGIDIDWEFPVGGGLGSNHHRAADRVNATALFKEFRKQLKAYGNGTGKHYLLTAAMPAGNVGNTHYELAKVGATLDWLNLMAYDMHGSWDGATDFDSPFKFDSADPDRSSAASPCRARSTTCSARAFRPASSWSACRSTATSTRASRRVAPGTATWGLVPAVQPGTA